MMPKVSLFALMLTVWLPAGNVAHADLELNPVRSRSCEPLGQKPVDLRPDFDPQQTYMEEIPAAILFDRDRARVKAMGKLVLGRLMAKWLERSDWTHVIVIGHSDRRGPADYNEWLSAERARRTASFLSELGVAPARIRTRSYGPWRPITCGLSAAAHARNRRVELVFVSAAGDDRREGGTIASAGGDRQEQGRDR